MSDETPKNPGVQVIHLDTSFLIRSLRAGSPEDTNLRAWLRSEQPVAMSAIAWAEFLSGPLSTQAVELARRVLTELIPFQENEAVITAILFNQSGRRRGSMFDCMIAATALNRKAQLATSNARDFKRLESLGLQLALLS